MDAYDLRARVAPVSLVFLPLTFILLALLPTNPLAVVVLLAAGPLAAVFSPIGRDWGKRIQPKLRAEWDGFPTTRMLRHRGAGRDRISATLRHCVEQATRICLPSKEQEAADPARADAVYEDATRSLRDLTRNSSDYPLVLSTNIAYGFHRNMLGARWRGMAFSCASAVITFALLLLTVFAYELEATEHPFVNPVSIADLVALSVHVAADDVGQQIVNPANVADSVFVVRLAAFVASVYAVGFWIFGVNKQKVKVAADEYAHQLINSAQKMALSI